MKQLYNFDTIYADTKNNYNPCDSSFKLSNPITNVKKISLKGIEFPIGFMNVRAGLNTLIIVYHTVTVYSYTLPPKNYTKITDLITDLNALTVSNSFTFSLNASNQLILTCSNTSFSFFVPTTPFSQYILGFVPNSPNYFSAGGVLTGTNMYNLNVDNYLNFYISNIPFKHNANANNSNSTFKVDCNAVYQMIVFNQENSNFFQSAELYDDNNLILNKIDVKIFDRFNQLLNNLDFSFTLEIESE